MSPSSLARVTGEQQPAASPPKPAVRPDAGNLGAVIWLTGLSGSGKSTLAYGAHRVISTLGIDAVVLDGDVLRHGVCRDLGYSDEDRRENIRRAGRLALSRAVAGRLAIVSLISPFDEPRRQVAAECEAAGVSFTLIYVNAPLAICERRDPKGLYRRARAGEVPRFTGISSPFEPPATAAMVIRTDQESETESIWRVVDAAMFALRRDPSFWVVI